MINHRFRSPAAVLAVATLLVTVSCGTKKADDSSDTTSPSGVTQTTEKLGDPVIGGSLTYSVEAETSEGWCLPKSQLAGSGIMVANTMFDSLFNYDENFKPQPYLAKSYSWNADNTALTIELRPNIKFSDGSPLTAQVVKLNLDVTIGDEAAVKKTGVSPLLFRFVYADVDRVEATGPLTVVVHTKRPYAALVDELAQGRNGIVAESQLMTKAPGDTDKNTKCAGNPIGTGPFKLVKWDLDKSMTLERNPNYWRKDAKGNQLPYLDKLTFVPIPGNPDRYNALQGGSIQAGHFNNQEQIDVIEKNTNFSLVREALGHKEVSYAMFNASSPAVSDPEVRRHVIMALDPDEINQINSGGVWKQATGPFDTKVIGWLKDSGETTYDPEAAKSFFAGKNLKLRISYTTDPTTKAYVEEMKSELAAAGVTAEIDDKDQSSLISQMLGDQWDIIMTRNHPGGDPDDQYHWWHTGSPVNFGKINDPEIDRLLEEGRTETDAAKRKTIYEDLNRALNKGAYNMWNWYTDWVIGADKKVKNLTGATFPDNVTKTMGMAWAWHLLDEAWVEK